MYLTLNQFTEKRLVNKWKFVCKVAFLLWNLAFRTIPQMRKYKHFTGRGSNSMIKIMLAHSLLSKWSTSVMSLLTFL